MRRARRMDSLASQAAISVLLVRFQGVRACVKSRRHACRDPLWLVRANYFSNERKCCLAASQPLCLLLGAFRRRFGHLREVPKAAKAGRTGNASDATSRNDGVGDDELKHSSHRQVPRVVASSTEAGGGGEASAADSARLSQSFSSQSSSSLSSA